jgi:4-hydroxybenzoyl-CoA reductase subunit beta
MLRMDGFDFHPASSAKDAVRLYASLDAPMFIAGGTDLLPNIKHKIVRPANLIGLAGVLADGIEETETAWAIGAGMRLSALAQFTEIPALGEAAGLVAGPQIRNMGTIGGNVLLDTRCLFYNQTEFWRKSLGYCLKAEGDWCHVLNSPKTCVAAQSSDTVPVLLALDASLTLLSPTGERVLKIRDLYRFDGMDHLSIAPGELLTQIHIPKTGEDVRGTYKKLRRRDSIDFPQLGLAVIAAFDGPRLTTLDIVVGAVNPQPKPIRKLDPFLGAPLTDTAIDAIASLVEAQTRPQASIIGDAGWRRTMAGIFAKRALIALRG